eukprot:TRINITY_DN3291_c0_g1_i1.p1 TRINITY_DN3291_c0_g1~~TRINITY_DN3291_c0_g1_i1.p1  ORF type:complete len:275 (-),score=35.03 TRINITY_DN3291_c0_g1_i1:471-1253(-)
MICLASFNIAINFGWSAFFVLSTPLFSKLGLNSVWVSFANAAGPVTGLLQPFIGAMSDQSESRWGKRRPFIGVGLLMAVLGMGLFANSEFLGRFIDSTHQLGAIVIAVSSLWLFNIGLNTIQAAGTAFLLDLCYSEVEKNRGMSYSNAFGGFASLLATGLGFVPFTEFLPVVDQNYQAVFYIGLFLCIVTTLPTLLYQSPQVVYVDDTEQGEEIAGLCRSFLGSFLKLDWVIIRILIVILLSNMAMSPLSFYFTGFVFSF